MDQRNIQNHVIPLLGDRFVDEVTRADIDQFKRAVREGTTADPNANRRNSYRGGAVVTGGTGVANRCLALLSKMFNLAERWGLRPEHSNPVRHVEKYREGKKERFLTSAEFERLAQVLAEQEQAGAENPYVTAALRLLILTGARLGEILSLQWDFVNLDHRALRLPDSKTGQKVIFLSEPAIDILASIPRLANNPFVIVGGKEGQSLRNLQKPWGRIRKAAGLTGVRIHDLRHSYASVAAAAGMSLPVIGKLLGHTKSTTTERYAHLSADPLKAANEVIGAQLSAFGTPKNAKR
jgi:integrase